MRYFVSEAGGDRQGPYSADEVRAMADQGRIGIEAVLTEADSGRQVFLADIQGSNLKSAQSEEPASGRAGPVSELPSAGGTSAAARQAFPWGLAFWAAVWILLIGFLLTIVLPVFASARKAATTSVALSNARELGTAVMIYLMDWDDRLPPDMSSAQSAKPFLTSYVKDPFNPDRDIFGSMSSNDSVLVGNPRLSGAKINDFEDPAAVMMFSDSHDWNDGKRIVLFLDSSVAMMPGVEVETASQNGFILSR